MIEIAETLHDAYQTISVQTAEPNGDAKLRITCHNGKLQNGIVNSSFAMPIEKNKTPSKMETMMSHWSDHDMAQSTMTKTIEEYIAGAEDISLMEARKAKEELVMQVQNLKEEAKILRTEAGEHSQQIDTLRGRGDELEGNNSREVLNSRVTPVSHLNLRFRVAICRNCHNT